MELISLYCPLGRLFLDAYAGTCTTAIAAFKCGRKVIFVGEDAVCFRLAAKRLQNLAHITRKQQTLPKMSEIVSTICKNVKSSTKDGTNITRHCSEVCESNFVDTVDAPDSTEYISE